MTPESTPRVPTEPAAPEREEVLARFAGPTFGLPFFAKVFPEFLSGVCPQAGGRKAVVLLHLLDGTVVELCHVEVVSPRWMAAAVFRSSSTCEEMDTVFIPFETIQRVTVSVVEASDRRMGFRIASVPAVAEIPGGGR